MSFRKKVIDYVKDGVASGELSKEQSHGIIQVMIEYKDLVAKGDIPTKTPEEAFKDIIDLYKYKHMAPTQRVQHRVHQAIDKIAPKYDVKNPSEELQEVHDMAEGLMEDMPDLGGKSPDAFAEGMFDIAVGPIPHKRESIDKRESIVVPKPGKKPRKAKKAYADYKWSAATLQKKQAKLERLAEKRALKEAYMALQGRAAKRAFNIEHGRYNIGRKAARTKRAWDSWNEDRKTAYMDRKAYDINTVDFDRQQKRAYHKSKRAEWSDARKAAWKEAWRTKTSRWNRKKGQKDAPPPVFEDKKKRAFEKLGKFKFTGPIPDRAKVKMNPVVEVEELPLEPARKKAKRNTRKEAEKLRDSFNDRPGKRLVHL